MKTFRAEVACNASYELAEGPVWDGDHERLLWVDIPRGKVLCGRLGDADVEVTDEHRFAGPAAAVVPTADAGLLVALRGAFATVSPRGELRTGRTVLPKNLGSRLNDGGCDPSGRFLVGSMSLDGRERRESLYRLDGAGGIEVVDNGLTLSNGLGWAPDGRTFYHVDSAPGIVWSRTYDPRTGAVGGRQHHLLVKDATPDGLCVDTNGNLWLAVWGAGQVRCFDPAGEPVATVDVAAPHTSSVAFVGPELDRLLITTARENLTEDQLDAWPLSGRLFLADVGAYGLPTVAWSGRCADIT